MKFIRNDANSNVNYENKKNARAVAKIIKCTFSFRRNTGEDR